MFFRGPSSFAAQTGPQIAIAQYLNDGRRKFRRVVANQNVTAVNGLQTLTSNRGGNGRLTHCPAIKDLEARASSDSNRHNRYGGLGEVRSNIRHVTVTGYSRIAFEAHLLLNRILPNQMKCAFRATLSDERPRFSEKEVDRISVREHVSRAEEGDASGNHILWSAGSE